MTYCSNEPTTAPLAILFSGGVDSLILAALVDRYVPLDLPIDLLNVAFGTTSFDVPDRKTGLAGLKELQYRSRYHCLQPEGKSRSDDGILLK